MKHSHMTSDVFFWTYLPTQPDLTLFYLIFTYLGLFEFLEDMAQMWHYINFFSHKPAKVTSDFILNYLKKVEGGTTQKYQKQILKY